MADEIERKFKVKAESLPSLSPSDGFIITQGYLSVEAPIVRVRIQKEARTLQTTAFLTVKGKGTVKRKEVETRISTIVAEPLMDMAVAKLQKQRWALRGPDGMRWVVDLFKAGQVYLAEIELDSVDETFKKPDWVGEEVTEDGRYSNVNLARYGFPVEFESMKREPRHPYVCGCGSTKYGPNHKPWDHAGWIPG